MSSSPLAPSEEKTPQSVWWRLMYIALAAMLLTTFAVLFKERPMTGYEAVFVSVLNSTLATIFMVCMMNLPNGEKFMMSVTSKLTTVMPGGMSKSTTKLRLKTTAGVLTFFFVFGVYLYAVTALSRDVQVEKTTSVIDAQIGRLAGLEDRETRWAVERLSDLKERLHAGNSAAVNSELQAVTGYIGAIESYRSGLYDTAMQSALLVADKLPEARLLYSLACPEDALCRPQWKHLMTFAASHPGDEIAQFCSLQARIQLARLKHQAGEPATPQLDEIIRTIRANHDWHALLAEALATRAAAYSTASQIVKATQDLKDAMVSVRKWRHHHSIFGPRTAVIITQATCAVLNVSGEIPHVDPDAVKDLVAETFNSVQRNEKHTGAKSGGSFEPLVRSIYEIIEQNVKQNRIAEYAELLMRMRTTAELLCEEGLIAIATVDKISMFAGVAQVAAAGIDGDAAVRGIPILEQVLESPGLDTEVRNRVNVTLAGACIASIGIYLHSKQVEPLRLERLMKQCKKSIIAVSEFSPNAAATVTDMVESARIYSKVYANSPELALQLEDLAQWMEHEVSSL